VLGEPERKTPLRTIRWESSSPDTPKGEIGREEYERMMREIREDDREGDK
jgi:hypothetical protein